MIDTYGWRTMIGAIVPLAILVLVLGVFMLKNVGELKNPKLDLPSVVLSTIGLRRTSLRVLERLVDGLGQPRGARLDRRGCRVLGAVRRTPGQNRGPAASTGHAQDARVPRGRHHRHAHQRRMPGHQHAVAVAAANLACASAFETGMAMLPAAAVGIIISPISGVVFDKFGPRAISIVGLAS